MNQILEYATYVAVGIGALFVLRSLFSSQIKQHHSNWNTLLDNFNFSTNEFYTLLREELKSHGISGIECSSVRIKEGNLLSSRRLYLRVEWKEYQYDMCAAPFGKGFFLSWWLLYKTSIGQIVTYKIPFIGAWLVKKWYPVTHYKVDTASMFMTYCHSSVLKVVKEITKDAGIRLSEQEAKPILKDIFKR